MHVSQFDKALVLVDISHCISASRLEEPARSVIKSAGAKALSNARIQKGDFK